MKTAVDLFCGSGAVTWGLKKANFKVVGAIDFDPIACATYKKNHKEVNLIQDDIKNVSPKVFAEGINGNLDLLVVCAPCQPFSTRNRHKSDKDERAKLILEAIRFTKELQPKLVFFENVPGLGKQPVYQKLALDLAKLGYILSRPRQVDAANLGVPQRRQRMILVAAKDEAHLKAACNIKQVKSKTVRHTIYDLPNPPVGKTETIDPLHYSRKHSAITIERLVNIPHDGGSRESLPDHLQLNCHKKLTKKSQYPDTYGRMKWDDVAPTLTTGCTDVTKGRYAHPVQNRAITLREAALLQSFPKSYKFVGNASQIATQIGNAVPPKMMLNIARSLHSAIQSG